MCASERPTPPGRRPDQPGPSGSEETIRTERLSVERKNFVFALKENQRGRFVRITEEVAGRRDTIIIPASGLGEFRQVLEQMIETAEATPPAPTVD